MIDITASNITTMEAEMIYHIYRECVADARLIFARYEKYHHCVSLDSLDRDMQDVFKRIALDYTRFMLLADDTLELESPAALPASLIRLCNNNSHPDRRSVYLDRIEQFMDKNQHTITRVFATIDFKCVNNDIESLRHSLKRANQLIKRMEMLLLGSQNIYTQQLRIVA